MYKTLSASWKPNDQLYKNNNNNKNKGCIGYNSEQTHIDDTIRAVLGGRLLSYDKQMQ